MGRFWKNSARQKNKAGRCVYFTPHLLSTLAKAEREGKRAKCKPRGNTSGANEHYRRKKAAKATAVEEAGAAPGVASVLLLDDRRFRVVAGFRAFWPDLKITLAGFDLRGKRFTIEIGRGGNDEDAAFHNRIACHIWDRRARRRSELSVVLEAIWHKLWFFDPCAVSGVDLGHRAMH